MSNIFDKAVNLVEDIPGVEPGVHLLGDAYNWSKDHPAAAIAIGVGAGVVGLEAGGAIADARIAANVGQDAEVGRAALNTAPFMEMKNYNLLPVPKFLVNFASKFV